MFYAALFTPCLSLLISQCLAQDAFPLAASRNNTFNATYGLLNPDQALSLIRTAKISEEQAQSVLVAVNFERSNWAGSSTQLDPFYQDVPSNASAAAPGSPIKIEQNTNTSLYTLPPGVALSRFLFTTNTLNGTTVPASAYVLWPWLPRKFKGISGLPVISWGDGTAGWSGECGPSHIRNLWYQFSGPFTLALQGYVVVAPDHAGLGLDHDAEGNFIPHQALANPAAGNDLIYAVQAAQKSWPSLSKQFVLVGHSQGGGAVWGATEQLAREPVEGYLGAVAESPLASIGDLLALGLQLGLDIGPGIGLVATGISSIFPSFQLSDWLVEKGVRLIGILQELQGCQSVAGELVTGTGLAIEGFDQTWEAAAFDNVTRSGGKKFAGPMLVLQGDADTIVPAVSTSKAVNETCSVLPNSQLQYTVLRGVTHVSVLYAGQQIWLDWIAERFKGIPVPEGCQQQVISAGTNGSYQHELGFTLQLALYPYEIA